MHWISEIWFSSSSKIKRNKTDLILIDKFINKNLDAICQLLKWCKSWRIQYMSVKKRRRRDRVEQIWSRPELKSHVLSSASCWDSKERSESVGVNLEYVALVFDWCCVSSPGPHTTHTPACFHAFFETHCRKHPQFHKAVPMRRFWKFVFSSCTIDSTDSTCFFSVFIHRKQTLSSQPQSLSSSTWTLSNLASCWGTWGLKINPVE